MGKYDPLAEKLRGARGQQLQLSFEQIEALLGADLPKSAREKRSWWANDDSGHASAWTGVGFEAEVDLEREAVVYRRAQAAGAAERRPLDHARELMDTGVDQARDLIASGAGQMRDTFGKAAPGARRAAPWLALGAGVAAVVGLLIQRQMRDRA